MCIKALCLNNLWPSHNLKLSYHILHFAWNCNLKILANCRYWWVRNMIVLPNYFYRCRLLASSNCCGTGIHLLILASWLHHLFCTLQQGLHLLDFSVGSLSRSWLFSTWHSVSPLQSLSPLHSISSLQSLTVTFTLTLTPTLTLNITLTLVRN